VGIERRKLGSMETEFVAIVRVKASGIRVRCRFKEKGGVIRSYDNFLDVNVGSSRDAVVFDEECNRNPVAYCRYKIANVQDRSVRGVLTWNVCIV
jgi:hypothetical protein